MKRLFSILTPFLVLGLVLYILIDFRQVEELKPEEKQAIDRYRQELVKGTLLNKNKDTGIFYKQDFDAIATSLDRLHQHNHFVVFGPEWGYKINNPKQEFAKVKAIINKKEYTADTRHKDFFDALRKDLAVAEQKFGTRESHDLIDDLSTLVFIEKIIDEKQWSNSLTIQVMKQKGLKLIKEDSTSTSASTNKTTTPTTKP